MELFLLQYVHVGVSILLCIRYISIVLWFFRIVFSMVELEFMRLVWAGHWEYSTENVFCIVRVHHFSGISFVFAYKRKKEKEKQEEEEEEEKTQNIGYLHFWRTERNLNSLCGIFGIPAQCILGKLSGMHMQQVPWIIEWYFIQFHPNWDQGIQITQF